MLLTATPTDIDECSEGIVDCDHNCTNTIGSYACSCYSGYELDSDNLSCSGKLNTIIMQILKQLLQQAVYLLFRLSHWS